MADIIDRLRDLAPVTNAETRAAMTEAADEIERLRAALEEIIIHCDWPDRVLKYARAALEGRSCTCHPSEAPTSCQRKYALGDCIKAALEGK